MAKIDSFIRDVEREWQLSGTLWEQIKLKYATPKPARIPAVRKKRVVRDRAPRLAYNRVYHTFRDGREVCRNDGKFATREGIAEYDKRRLDMAERQEWHCADCYYWMAELPGSHLSVTFDHQNGRGGGKRDDRIWTPEGIPQNAALCYECNSKRGSTRRPYHYQTKLTREEFETTHEGN